MIAALSGRRAAVCVLVALSGCHEFFDLETVSLPPDADTNADAGLVGGRPSFCGSGPLLDEFVDASFCYWASRYDFPQVRFAQHDDVVDILADGTVAAFAGCTGFFPLPFTDNGMYAHIPSVMSGDRGYTKLTVRHTYQENPPPPVMMSADLLHENGELKLVVNDIVIATRDDTPAWWRLRRPGGGDTVAAELSADGITWELFGSATAQMPATFAIDIGAGINLVPTTAGMATFAAIGVCD